MAALSLQEQMLKAGLVNAKKLNKAKKGSKKSRVQAREVKAAVEANRIEQQERDKALNKQQKEAIFNKEIQAQVKQLIEMNRLTLEEGDVTYNFMDGKLIKSLHIQSWVRDQLIKGVLAIARYEEGYAVIPGVVADKIFMRDEDSIIENKTVDETTSLEDDPYADFVVPDDLMW